MTRLIRIVILLTCITFGLTAFCSTADADDNCNVRIIILDQKMIPLSDAEVNVVLSGDTVIADALCTSHDGEIFLPLRCGHYTSIGFSCFGYHPLSLDLPLSSDSVVLTEDVNILSEIVVSGKRPVLQHRAGRFIFDPTSLSARSLNAYGLLKLTPLLEVKDSQFAILGKGDSKVFINGRDPKTDNLATMEMLKALPPERIKRIEIITNPGSAFGASASGGIINVIVDNPREGFVGSASATADYSNERFEPGASVYGAFTSGKFKSSANAFYSARNPYSKVYEQYDYPDAGRSVSNLTRNHGWGNILGIRFNFSYDLTSASTLGLAINLKAAQSNRYSHVESSETNQSDGTKETKDFIGTSVPWTRPNYGLQAFYTLKTDNKGSKLDVVADYTSNLSKVNTRYDYDSDATIHQHVNTGSRAVHFKPGYVHNFNDSHSLRVGYEFLHSQIDNDYRYPEHDNRFIFKETLNCAYAEWSALWSDAFSSSAGLRLENTTTKGHQTVGNEYFENSYTDLFPTISFSLDIPCGGQNVSLAFSRWITRPFYSSLNPYVYWTSPTTYSKGNIYLKPDYTWDVSLYYTFLYNFVFGSVFKSTSDSYLDYKYRDANNNTVSSSGNFGTGRSCRLFLTYNRNLFSLWNIKSTLTANYTDTQATVENTDLSYSAWDYSFSILNSITLSSRHSLEATVDYSLNSPVEMLTGKSKFKNLLSIGLSKRFGNGLAMSFEANNILAFKNEQNYWTPGYSYRQQFRYNPFSASLNVRYSFGKRSVSRTVNRYNSPLDNRTK